MLGKKSELQELKLSTGRKRDRLCRVEDEMTTQMLFTVIVSLAGLAGMAYGLWVVRRAQITLRRGATTERITGPAARRMGLLIFIGAIGITLVGLLVFRPLF